MRYLPGAPEGDAEESAVVSLLHGVQLVGDTQAGGFGLGEEGADFPAGLAAAFAHGMGAEDAEGVAVVAADDGFDLFWCHGRTIYCNAGAARLARGAGPIPLSRAAIWKLQKSYKGHADSLIA